MRLKMDQKTSKQCLPVAALSRSPHELRLPNDLPVVLHHECISANVFSGKQPMPFSAAVANLYVAPVVHPMWGYRYSGEIIVS